MRPMAAVRPYSLFAVLLCASLALCVPATAHAQDGGKVGLAIRAPQSVGIIMHLTDGLALLPSFDVGWSSSRSEIQAPGGGFPENYLESAAIKHSQAVLSMTLAARLRLGGSSDTSWYVAPSYSRYFASNDDSYFASTSTKNNFATGVGLGVQHDLNDRVRVFGEAGLRYSQYRIETGSGLALSLTQTSTFKSAGTAASVGVIYYFKR